MLEQSSRIVQIKTPLPEGRHAVTSMNGHERINELYSFQVTIITDGDPIKPDELLGQDVSLKIEFSEVERDIAGIVSGFWQTEAETENLFEYKLEIVPPLWILGMCTHNRVFTEMNTIDIVMAVISEGCGMSVDNKTTGTPLIRETCIQYGETDLDFMRRLLEDEGIAFFFEHSSSSAKIVLVDAATAFPECDPATYPYNEKDRASFRQGISQFRRGGRLGVRKIESTDYLEWASQAPQVKEESSSAKAKLKPGEMEIYGRQNFKTDGTKRSFVSGAAKTQLGRWLDSIQPDDALYDGKSAIPSLTAGHTFSLEDAPKAADGLKDFLILEITHSAAEGLDADATYSNTMQCAPKQTKSAFLPDFQLEKPRIWGVQSAKVMEEKTPNPSNAQAEVKVQYHWDTQNQTCWARVAQLYAGNKWGGYFVPRLGQEVLVEFINGDPDRPVVIGAVYNQDNPTPPYKKWQSGIRSSKGRTTPNENSSGKSDDTYNELRFDDTTDKEEVYFQAQKDHNFLVKNNQTGHIMANQDIHIGSDGKGDAKLYIEGNQVVDIDGDQTIKVGVKKKSGKIFIEAGKSITLKVGDTKLVIDQNNIKLDAPMNIDIKAGMNIKLDAGMDLSAKAGMNIKAKADMNVNIEATMNLDLKASLNANMKGTMIKVDGSAMSTFKGGAMATLDGGAMTIVKGGLVKLN